MSLRILLAPLSILALSAACGGARPAPAAAPGPAMSGAMEHAMMNCPCSVAGARTTARDVDGGIALDIVAPTADGEAAIRDAAALHAKMGPPTDEHAMHTGDHGGPGTTGHCPVMHVGAQVLVTPIDGGARVTVLAIGDTSVDELRRSVRARLDALPAR